MKHKLYFFLRKDWVYQNFPTLESALEFVLNEKIMSRKGKNSNFEIRTFDDVSILSFIYSPTQDGLHGVTYDTSNEQIQQFLDNHFFDNL